MEARFWLDKCLTENLAGHGGHGPYLACVGLFWKKEVLLLQFAHERHGICVPAAVILPSLPCCCAKVAQCHCIRRVTGRSE